MRAHCPVRRLTAPVWLSTTMCLHISWRSLTLSLNANTNVRNTFSENIYTPGVGEWERQGGVFCGNVWGEWIRAYTREGCRLATSGGRVRVGVRVCPTFKRPHLLLASGLRVNALRPRLALMPWLALIVSCALTVPASTDLR